MIGKPAPCSRRKNTRYVQERHEHADLESAEGKGFEVKAPVRGKGADKSEMEEIKAGKAPVGDWLHLAEFNSLWRQKLKAYLMTSITLGITNPHA